MKVYGLADVKRGEDCEYVGLDRCNQELDHAHEHDEEEAQNCDSGAASAVAVDCLDDKIAKHVEQDVACEHRDERPKSEAEGTNEEADQLNRSNEKLEDEWRVLGHEQRKEVQSMSSKTRRRARSRR